MLRVQWTAIGALLSISAMAAGQTPAPATPPPAAAIPGPTLASAEQMLSGARAKAMELGVKLACAVVDVRGDLVAAFRMDGADFLTITVAQAKARTSALTGRPSGGFGDRGVLFQGVATLAGVTALAAQGAVPIVRGGTRIGGIGCSGGVSAQDEQAASAGLNSAQ
jgi:uncharacterized protein GlcG (DUF336 family)